MLCIWFESPWKLEVHFTKICVWKSFIWNQNAERAQIIVFRDCSLSPFQRRRRLSAKASSILAPFLNERASHCNAQMHWQCQRHDTWPGLAWFCCVVYERARASTQERRASATPLSINNTNTDNDWSKKHALPLPLDTLIRPYSDGTEWKVVIIITINCHHVCCLLRFCSLFFFLLLEELLFPSIDRGIESDIVPGSTS